MDNQQETVAELAWLAGFIDGEGTIAVTYTRSHKKYRPIIGVGSSSVVAIEKVVDIARRLGVSLSVHLRPPSGLQKTDLWYAGTRQFAGVRILLEAMLPYLVVKAPHARLLLEFVKSRQAKDAASMGKGKKVPYSDEEIRAVTELRALNSRRGFPTDYTRPPTGPGGEDIVEARGKASGVPGHNPVRSGLGAGSEGSQDLGAGGHAPREGHDFAGAADR